MSQLLGDDTLHVVAIALAAGRTSLESLGSLYMSIRHAWCACPAIGWKQGEGVFSWSGLLTCIASHVL